MSIRKWIFSVILLQWSFLSFAADTPSQKSQQLKQVNSKIAVLKKNLQLTEKQRVALQKKLKKTANDIAKISAVLKTLNQKMTDKQEALSETKMQLTSMEKELAYQKKILGKQLRASYQLGEYEYFQMLLNEQNPATVSRLTTYYHYIHKARLDTLEEIQKTEKEIKEKQNLLSEQVQQLERLSRQSQQKKALLEKNQDEHQHIMAMLNIQIKKQTSRLEEYQSDKKALEALLVRLEKSEKSLKTSVPSPKSPTAWSPESSSLASNTSFKQMAHRLDWPTQGRLLSRSASRILRNEPGIVILAPEGQHVTSTYSGKVVFAGWLKGFGLLIIIDHGQGFMTLYAHNQTLYRKRGDNVKTGDWIANVGHTGILPQSGLYFEIRYNGKPLNPLQWLRPARTK